MKLSEVLEGNEERDAYALLESINLETASDDEVRNLLKHLKFQFKTRYKYIVGEWRNAKRAKSTRNGRFVSRSEVVEYLDN